MKDVEAKNRIINILSTKSLTANQLKSHLAIPNPLFNRLISALITERRIRYTGRVGEENIYELTELGKLPSQPDY
ncbi:hypothetical protein GCM10027190_31450 [Spirosoma areae]